MARNATPRQGNSKRPDDRQDKATATSLAGASARRTSWRSHLESWRDHHIASALDALKRMRRNALTSLMTMLVIAIATALPAGLQLLVANAAQLTDSWRGNVHLSVFLEHGTDHAAQQSLADTLQQRADIERLEVITPEQALAEFKQLSDFSDALDVLPDNPLPPLLIVFPADPHPDSVKQLQQSLGQAPDVAHVQMDVEWVQRLHTMIDLASKLVFSLGLALSLGVVLVVVNTLRLAIENRRDEILVVKLVGGTDGFVRRPFLYTGWWFGFGGGLLALVLVQLLLWWLSGSVNQLTALYGSEYTLTGLSLENIFTLPLTTGLLALGGAWLAVSRHIQDIDPSHL